MKTKEEARAIVNGLKALYPDGICSLQYQKIMNCCSPSACPPSVPMPE